jgi:predicted ester cyclase
MSPDEVNDLLRRFAVTPWTSGDLDALDSTMGEGYVLHPDMTLEDLKTIIRDFRRGFPDLSVTLEDIISEGDRIAYRWTMRGTHQGEIEGIAPTGRPMTATGISMLRVQDGKVVEDPFESSSPSMQEQLGRV